MCFFFYVFCFSKCDFWLSFSSLPVFGDVLGGFKVFFWLLGFSMVSLFVFAFFSGVLLSLSLFLFQLSGAVFCEPLALRQVESSGSLNMIMFNLLLIFVFLFTRSTQNNEKQGFSPPKKPCF